MRPIPIWMLATAAAAALAVLMSGVAAAQTASTGDPVYMGDVAITYQPQPSGYQPQGSDIDMADQGKSFDIRCTIGATGALSDCRADNNGMYDQNFVRIALGNVGQWIVAPRTADGRSSAGRTMVVTCQFNRSDRTDVAVADSSK